MRAVQQLTLTPAHRMGTAVSYVLISLRFGVNFVVHVLIYRHVLRISSNLANRLRPHLMTDRDWRN